MLPPIPLSRTTSPTRRCNLKPLRTTCVVIPKSAGRRCSCDLPNLGHHRSLPGSLGNGCNGCMDLMMPNDSMFLFIESREHPMHVGGLSLFEPPQGAGPEFVREFTERLVANDEFQPMFRKHPATIGGGIARVAWAYDDDIDIDYHVRRSALPSPGRVRDLLELTSRLHTSLLDRHRPLWELHVVEGLNDGRFAMYTKMHHALIDGVSAMKLAQRTLSADPDDAEVRAIWNLPPRPRTRPPSDGSSLLDALFKMAGSVVGLAPSTLKLARAALLEQQLTLPFAAPHSMFNVKVGGARRCAAQSWSLDRIKSVKQAAGVTVNDAVLAMCAGALRYYLIERNALPDRPLIAMVPVSLRPKRTLTPAATWSAASCAISPPMSTTQRNGFRPSARPWTATRKCSPNCRSCRCLHCRH